MKKPYLRLFFLLTCLATNVNAAVVTPSNPSLNEQLDHSSQGDTILELDEACGTTYEAHEHDHRKPVVSENDETEHLESSGQKELHSYENYVFYCHQYFAQFN